jgi:hypothetical protein
MKHQLYEFICDTLSTRAIQARGVFRADRVNNLLQEHTHGNQDASNKIFVMVMLELWFQYFSDRRHEIYAKS